MTKKQIKDDMVSEEVKKYINPPLEEEKMNQLFTGLIYVDKKDRIMYTDLTGNFPMRSIDAYITFFIFYDWTTNTIMATPIKGATDESVVEAIKKIPNTWQSQGSNLYSMLLTMWHRR